MTERPRYFFGQVIGVDELQQEQSYLREKARRHNRLLHGWGIVRGLEVKAGKPGTGEVTISPGYALDPRGEEVVVGESVTVDLSGHAVGKTLFLAVRHDERLEHPVPSPQGTEYSRIRETFAVEVLTSKPRRKTLVPLGEVELGRRRTIARIGAAHRRHVGG